MKPSPDVVLTLQDPCYLSRAESSAELPRRILQAVPDVRFQEMKNVKTQTNCCGGGGGGLWMQDHGATRINDLRAKEAYASGADVLITLCPYCLTMLEDGIRNLDTQGSLVVKDLGEFVAECF